MQYSHYLMNTWKLRWDGIYYLGKNSCNIHIICWVFGIQMGWDILSRNNWTYRYLKPTVKSNFFTPNFLFQKVPYKNFAVLLHLQNKIESYYADFVFRRPTLIFDFDTKSLNICIYRPTLFHIIHYYATSMHTSVCVANTLHICKRNLFVVFTCFNSTHCVVRTNM